MVTMQDIADRTGFSLAVVSRALNPKPDQKVAARSGEIIRKTAAEMGYRPNQAARLLAKGASPAIGIFLPLPGNELICQLAIGLSSVANQFGFSCSFYYGLKAEDYQNFVNISRNVRNAGIITYLSSDYSHDKIVPMLHELCDHRCQVIALNTPEMLNEANLGSVAIDNRAGGRIAAEHLLQQGIRKFLVLGENSSWQLDARANGFAECIRQHGRPCEIQDCCISTMGEFGLPELKEMLFSQLCSTREPLGVFAGCDTIALTIYSEMARRGAADRIGREVRLVGFDALAFTELLHPGLTSMRQPFEKLGEIGMSCLINRLLDAKIPVPNPLIAPELIIRGSSGIRQ